LYPIHKTTEMQNGPSLSTLLHIITSIVIIEAVINMLGYNLSL
jgi:hypothetical protein